MSANYSPYLFPLTLAEQSIGPVKGKSMINSGLAFPIDCSGEGINE